MASDIKGLQVDKEDHWDKSCNTGTSKGQWAEWTRGMN